jgi:hypothetical protein
MMSTGFLTIEQFFEGFPESRKIFNSLKSMIDATGPSQVKITKSQIAFVNVKPFAWAWIPGRYLRGKTAPLVLTFSFPEKDRSPRWKEITEVRGKFTHHLELFSSRDVDDEVRGWLEHARQSDHPDAA